MNAIFCKMAAAPGGIDAHPPFWYTENKNLVEVRQMGIKNGSWLVNILVTLGY